MSQTGPDWKKRTNHRLSHTATCSCTLATSAVHADQMEAVRGYLLLLGRQRPASCVLGNEDR